MERCSLPSVAMLMDKEGSAGEETEGWAGDQRLPENAVMFFPAITRCLSWFPRFFPARGKRPVGGVTRARHGADRGGNARGRRESPLRTSRAPMRVSGTFAWPRAVPIAILGSVFSWPEGAPQSETRGQESGRQGGRCASRDRGNARRRVARGWWARNRARGRHAPV